MQAVRYRESEGKVIVSGTCFDAFVLWCELWLCYGNHEYLTNVVFGVWCLVSLSMASLPTCAKCKCTATKKEIIDYYIAESADDAAKAAFMRCPNEDCTHVASHHPGMSCSVPSGVPL